MVRSVTWRRLLLVASLAIVFALPAAPAQASSWTSSQAMASASIYWKGTGCLNGVWGGGWCQLYNGAYGLCLSANPYGDMSNGDAVELWQCPYPGMSTQQVLAESWTLVVNSGGSFHYNEFVNRAHNLCLDASASGDGSNGDTVQLWSCWGGVNQLWNPAEPPPSGLEFWNVAHNMCLDANASQDNLNGDPVHLWSCWGGANQLWGNVLA